MRQSMTTENKIYRICLSGMLIGLGMIFSYLEALVPINLGVPGVKLGLANLVTIVALYQLNVKSAALIAFVRVILSSILFSNMTVMLYSLAGAALSLLVMAILARIDIFSKTGVSIAGGVAHNIGQLLVAWLVIENANVLYYLPVLLIAGTVAGACIGILASLISKKLYFLFMKP